MSKKKILVINGPNMNLLGIRQPEIYGRATYQNLKGLISAEADKLGVKASFFQSNHEGALLDAVKAVGIPTVEVHVSDPDSREEFRHVSYIRQACIATIRGHGLEGYLEALRLQAK